MKPAMQPVASTMMRAAGYDAGSQKLYVEFLNGTTWAYDDVPEEIYDGLIGGGSAGAFFRNNVRDSFDGREV